MPGWIFLDMSEYTGICVNFPKFAWMAFVLYFPIVIPCLLESVVSYFNVYTKLEVLVWRKIRLFSSRHKTFDILDIPCFSLLLLVAFVLKHNVDEKLLKNIEILTSEFE